MHVRREIKVMYDAPHVPADVYAAMTEAERHAFRYHADAFGQLAASATHPDIRRYLERIATQNVFWLMLYSEEESAFRVYFHHTVVEARAAYQIRLPRKGAVPAHVPAVLRPAYLSFGGVREDYGGLRCPENIIPFSEVGYWLSDANEIDPVGVFVFYEVGNGDAIGYTASGSGVFYDHEEGLLSPYDLSEFTTTYFREFLPAPTHD
jgi:hypothetical protein